MSDDNEKKGVVISIIVDDKQAMIDHLQNVLSQGDNFFNECCNVLVDEWGADRSKIIDDFRDMCRGQIIGVIVDKKEFTPPAEYVAENLELLCRTKMIYAMGMTYPQYRQELQKKKDAKNG